MYFPSEDRKNVLPSLLKFSLNSPDGISTVSTIPDPGETFNNLSFSPKGT